MLDLASGISGVKLLAFDTDSGNTYVVSSSLGAVCQLTRTGGMFSRRCCTCDAYAIAMQLLPLQLCLKIDFVSIHLSSCYVFPRFLFLDMVISMHLLQHSHALGPRGSPIPTRWQWTARQLLFL
jgi:hypothetical protein